MGQIATFPGIAPASASLIASLLNKHSPHEIAEAVEILIDVLDLLGGDADMEEDDDSGDFASEETEGAAPHGLWLGRLGPGCPVSDPGGCEHDGREEEEGF